MRCRKIAGEVDSLSGSLGGKNGRVDVVSGEKECEPHSQITVIIAGAHWYCQPPC